MAEINRQEDLYIINTLKCRPPQNRKPKKEEKLACEKFLKKQIELVNPEVIVLCGATAMESFLDKSLKISKVRGSVFEIENRKFVPIFHPSYLLRQHSKEENAPRSLTVKDLKMIKKMTLF